MRKDEDKIPSYELNYILPVFFGLIGTLFVWGKYRHNQEPEIKKMVRNCWLIFCVRTALLIILLVVVLIYKILTPSI